MSILSARCLPLAVLLNALATGGLASPARAAHVCPPQYGPYTLRQSDICIRLMSMRDPDLHFTSLRQIEQINYPLFRFTCAKAAKGQLVCHPRTGR